MAASAEHGGTAAGMGGGDRDRDPPHLQPAPLQKAPHGFQLGLGITTFPLHLLQVAGVGLQGVEGPDGVLERPPEVVRMAPITAASGLCPPPRPRGASLPCAHCTSTHPVGLSSLGSTRSRPRRRHLRHGPAGMCRQRQRLSRGCRGDGLLIGKGNPPLPGCPLTPRGGGTGQPSTQHPPPPQRHKAARGRERAVLWCWHLCPLVFNYRRKRSNRAAPAWRTRDTATAAARGHRCHRAPGTRTGGDAGLAPAPPRWGPGVGQARVPSVGTPHPSSRAPSPQPAARGPVAVLAPVSAGLG